MCRFLYINATTALNFIFKVYFYCLCVLCVSACECVHMIPGALESQRYKYPGARVADCCDDIGAGHRTLSSSGRVSALNC